MLAIVVFVVAAGTPAQVRGAVRTWDGGGADNSWNTPANWSSDAVPGAMDRAVFDGTSTKDATINVNVSVQGVQIDVGYTGTITQAAGSTLTVGVADFSQAAGTFVGGTAAITINNAFTLSGGSFTSTMGTLTITGAVTKSGGVFAHNSGTVAFSTSNVTINVGGTETFNNVSFLSGTKTIAAGNTLVVTGTLNLAGGGLSTGTLAAQGDINAQLGFTGGGTATLLINGAGAQTFTGFHTTTTGSLPNVDINKPSGTLTLAGTLRTARSWTYTSGGLTATGSTLIFNGTQTITGSHALNAVEIRGGTLTIAAGTTLTVGGTLNLFSGGLNTGTLAAQGNINAQIGFTGGGTATLLINGAGAQTFTGFHTTTTGSLPNVDINKPSGTLTLAGTLRTARNWTYTAGTLTATGSTLIFNGTQTITGSHALNAVEIRGGTLTIAAGTTLTVGGTLNLFSGGLNTGTLAAQGNINAQIGFTGGGTATLLINGAGAQTFTGFHTTTTGSLPNVDINKPSGTLTLAGTLRTARSWTYTSGGLTATGSTLIFNGTQTITGSHALNAVEIRGGTLTIAAGTTLTVGGTLNLFSGTVNTGTLAAQGNINAQIGFTGGGTATLLINGAGAQTFTGFHTTATGSLPNVDIAKPSGTLTLAGTLRTARSWTYTSGGLTATGSTLIFSGTQTITGSHTLANVEIRGGTVTIAAGTTLTVTGTLNLFSGGLSTGTLAAQGSIDAQIGFTGGGTATLLINGTGAQTFTGFHTTTTGSLPVVDINKPSGTLTLAGTLRTARNWTYTSGGLTATGSTLVFNGNLTISGDHALNNVELRSGNVTVTPGDTLTVGGLLTLTDGSLEGGTMAALGDIALAAAYDGETGTVRIAGTADQTLTGAANTTSSDMAHIVIDKPSGTLTLVGTIRMVTSSWTWLQGAVDPGTSTVYFDTTVTISGTHSLFNVYLSGGAHMVTGGDTLTALGTLTLDNGTIDGGTIAAAGSLTQLSSFDGGNGLLRVVGTGNQTFDGFATIGAGDLPAFEIDKPSGILTLTGIIRTTNDWTHLNGTVDPDASTLIFRGTQTITGSHTLNNVEIRGGTVTIAAGTTLTVTGTLNLFSGGLNTGTLAAQGSIDAQIGFTGGGTATLLINGAGAQTFTGFHTTTTGALPNVDIDKPSGTLTLVGTIRMVTSSWTWLQGAVDPGTSTVYFDTTVTISGTHSLFNVYLSGGAHMVTGGDTLTALGTLTLDNGTIDGGTIAAAGSLTQLSSFDGGNGLLRVVGTGNQTFDGFATIGAGDLPAFEIDKPSGILTLTGIIRTTNDWTHLNGTVDPDASLVVFATDLTIDAAGMTFADIQVTSGTATLASELNVGGNLFVSGGTLDAAGNTVTVGGDVTIDGAFTPGTGLLVMNGVVPQTLGGAAASIGLYDFIVNNAAGVTITTAVSVAGTLTLNGPLDISGQTLGIANPIAGTPTDLTGDPLSSLVVSGTGAGIVIPSSLPVLANLTLDNPNGAALTGPLTIGSLLTLTDGVLDAGAWVVVIDPAASLARTAGHVSGELRKTIPLGAGVAVTFEIGDATTYAPVSLLFGMVSGSGTITASTTPGDHPNIGSSVIDPAQDVNRWWSLVNGGTVFNTLDATFTFDPADVDPGASTAAFVVAKWDGAWVLPASSAALPTSITAFGMISLSEFAVGEVESADLPDTAQGTPTGLGLLLTGLGLLGLVSLVMRRTRGLAVAANRG